MDALLVLPFKKRNPWFLVAGCIVDEHRVNGRKRRELRRGGGEAGLCGPPAYHREQTSKSLNGKTNYKRRGVPRTVARQCVLAADWRDAVSCPLLPARSSR